MAELVMRVRAEYESAIACREELKKVEAELKKVNENTSPKEIARLTQRYAELSAKWQNGLSNIGKIGYYAKDAFSKIGNVIKGVTKDVENNEDASSNLYSTLVKRLDIEKKISEETAKQKTQAQAQLDNAKEGYNRNKETFDKLSERMSAKYGGKAEGFWSEKDQQQMERGRESLSKWGEEIKNREIQVNVLSDILQKSEERLEEYKVKLSNFDLPQLDLKSNIDDMVEQINAGEQKVDDLKGQLVSLTDELNQRTDFQGAKNRMYDLYDEIGAKKTEIDDLQQSIDGFSISNLISQQQSLSSYADEVAAKLQKEDDTIAELKAQQEGLNEQSAMYKSIQDSIDLHTAEREKYAQILDTTNKSIEATKAQIENETKAHTDNQQKIKELTEDVKELSEQYKVQQEIVNNSDANKEAIQGIKEEIRETKEQIDQTTNSTEQLRDILGKVGEVYEKNKANSQEYYKGFVGTDYEKSNRVYTNEGAYNEANALELKAEQLQQQITKGVKEGSLTQDELKALQDELTATQEKFNEFDSKARDTAMLLGNELGGKAAAMTKRLFEANKAVEEAQRVYDNLNRELEKEKALLTAIEENTDSQKSIADQKQKVDELTDSLNKQAEALASVKAEQKDAQTEIDKTTGELGDALEELKTSEGVFGDIEKAISMLPAPLRTVADNVKGVGSAMKVLAKSPLMIALGALVLVLQSVWKWFNKSAEGQRAFAKISGYVGGVIIRLEELMVKFGGTVFKVTKAIAKAFLNPIDSIKQLGDKIQNYLFRQVHNIFQAFGSLGTLLTDIFTGKWDKIGKDLDKAGEKFKTLLKDSPMGKVVKGVKDAADATADWVKETHRVAIESKNIAAEERELGLEIEANREKTLKLQKSMAELQATMRNTNISKAERKKALEEYKKQLEEQANIQRNFAEKRRSLHQRKLNLDEPDTIEEMQEQAALANAVLEADVSKQRSLTALTRVTNSINKGESGKSKERLNEEYQLLLNENAQKQAKQIRENGYVIEQARINSMKEGTERTIAQMKLDYKKELDAAVEYEEELKKQKLKQARDIFYKDPKNKKKTFDLSSVDVSMTEQEKQVSAAKVSDAKEKYRQQLESVYNAYSSFSEKREKRERDYQAVTELTNDQLYEKSQELGRLYSQVGTLEGAELKTAQKRISVLEGEIGKLEEKNRIIAANKALQDEEMKARLEYLKQYGTMAEQREAIEAEFDQKIAAARAEGNVWGAASLEQQKKQALDKQDLESIKSQMDWEGIFNNLDRYSGEFLETIRTQLQSILNDPNITPENAKVVSDALDKLDGAIVEKTGNTFNWINSYLLEQKRLQEEAKRAAEAYDKALGEQIDANIELAGNKSLIEKMVSRISGGSVDLSNEDFSSTSKADIFKRLGIEEGSKEAEKLNVAFDKLASTEQKVSKASSEVEKAEKKKQSAEEKAQQKTSEKVAGWLKGVNDNVQKYLGDLPNLLGTLGFGEAGEKIQKGLNGINDAAGAAADFASGNYVGAAMKGISAINNFGEALGAWSNSNRAEVERENEKLSVAMSVNTEAVNRLTDAMKKATPAEAFKYYEQAVSALELNEQSARQKMENNAYMYDGGHSLNYDLDDANGTIRAIFNLLGKKPNGDYDLGGLLRTLSAKEWNELYKTDEGRKLLQQLGQAIAGAEDDGNYNGMFQDILDYINSYNEDAYQELANQFNEAVTNISFDSMYSSFVSSLMDMDKKAQDFTQDFEGYMRNAIYQSLAAEQIKPLLEEWYGAFAYYMSDGELSPDEIKALKSGGGTYKDQNGETKEFKSLNSIEQTGLKIRDGIEQLGLYNGKNGYNQTATGKSLENMSYTQADSLIGIATAQQIALEQSRDRLDILNVKADQVYMLVIESRDIAADSRQILAGMAIHVEEIRDGMVDTLVPAIKDMRSDLAKVRKLVEEQ